MSASESDVHWMRHCVALSRLGGRAVRPNPMVGAAVVDENGQLLGEGWHRRFGGPHAEVEALDAVRRESAEADLSTATLYVTLEPCSHQGKTPPCTARIIAEGVGRVVIGVQDPFPSVDGAGIAALREAGIEVTVGIGREDCEAVNVMFLHHAKTGRPYVRMKIAQTLDGFSAPVAGGSRWITGEAARRRVHALRSEADAVLVGTGTALADDPALTVRDVEGPQPRRIVIDRTGKLLPSLQLLSDAHVGRTIVATSQDLPYAEPFRAAGGTVLDIPEHEGRMDLEALLQGLGSDLPGTPVQSLLVEPGPRLAGALLRHRLVEELLVFISPRLLGAGRKPIEGWSVPHLDDAIVPPEVRYEQVGSDMLVICRPLFRGEA